MIGSRPDFMDWIEIVNNTPRLKNDAPNEVRIAFEDYQKAQDEEQPDPEEKV